MVDATGTVIRKADDVADVATDIAKHGDDFVQSLPSSKKLRRNLELAGVEVPDYPNAAHHIVAGSAPGAENAREKPWTKFGIDINDCQMASPGLPKVMLLSCISPQSAFDRIL